MVTLGYLNFQMFLDNLYKKVGILFVLHGGKRAQWLRILAWGCMHLVVGVVM